MNRRPLLLSATAMMFAPLLHGQASLTDLTATSLEDLTQAKILISSVSRKEQDIDQAPAAVYVIDRKQIERSTASSIPDLLRGVPGIQVAQINAGNWAISARGFNSAFANKLLVLVDGRSVYSEIYSGGHWDEIDMPLINVERIEIIRGPGAAVWGANAVNGVINIITRAARETEGTTLGSEYSGTERRGLLQKGGPLGDRAQYRLGMNYVNYRALRHADGTNAFDGQGQYRGSGRLDFQKSAANAFTLTGSIYHANMRQQINSRVAPFFGAAASGQEYDAIRGGFLQGSWTQTGTRSTTSVQTHFSQSVRHELGNVSDSRGWGTELVSHLRATPRIDLVWGAETRLTWDRVSTKPVLLLDKPSYFTHVAGGFLQADFTVKPSVLVVTIGSKVQDGTLTGAQLQPSARLLWNVNSDNSLWSAISRAVVAPSLQDKALHLPVTVGSYAGVPVVAMLKGDWNYKPEEVIATELGYRHRFGRSLSLDTAFYLNHGRRIQSLTTGTPHLEMNPAPAILVDETYSNGFSSLSQGAEALLQWRPASNLELSSTYTLCKVSLRQTAAGTVSLVDAPATPRNAFSGTIAYRPTRAWSLSAFLSGIGRVNNNNELTVEGSLPANLTSLSDYIPQYTRFDVKAERKIRGNLNLQAGGTNLLQARHREFNDATTFLVTQSVPRSLFLRAVWSFQ